MKKEIKEFIRTNEKLLILDHDKGANVITELKKIRSSPRIIFNYLLMQLCKVIPSVTIKHWTYHTLLGMAVGKNVGFGIIEVDPFLPELITVGDNSTIGWGTSILTHEYTPRKVRVGRVDIGKNVLVGAFCVIRSGVIIGDNSAVAMNSLVNKDIPPNELWGGVPAKRIRKLEEPL